MEPVSIVVDLDVCPSVPSTLHSERQTRRSVPKYPDETRRHQPEFLIALTTLVRLFSWPVNTSDGIKTLRQAQRLDNIFPVTVEVSCPIRYVFELGK